jgi:hypothetical protein
MGEAETARAGDLSRVILDLEIELGSIRPQDQFRPQSWSWSQVARRRPY